MERGNRDWRDGLTGPAQQSEAYFRSRYAIDEATVAELLGVAMSRGGDHGELFFEHREGSNITFEQQAVKSASRSVTQGLGVRVLQGEAIGYAFTEDLSRDAMRRAADTPRGFRAAATPRRLSTWCTTRRPATFSQAPAPWTCCRPRRSN